MSLLIDMKQVRKVYQTGSVAYEALKGIDLQIHEGEYVAIVGPSGSGKSTCMHIIGLLDTLDSGSYQLDGHDINDLEDDDLALYRNELIGFVFQSFNLLPGLTLQENVALPLFYAGVPRSVRLKKALEALDQLGMADFAPHRPNELSGGQKQRGAIARALINQPRLILADEPTGNLDSQSSAEVLKIFSRLHEEGRTILLITHDAVAAQYAERQVAIFDGRISQTHATTVKGAPLGNEATPAVRPVHLQRN